MMLAAVFKGNKNIVLSDYPRRTFEHYKPLVKTICRSICSIDKNIYEVKASSVIPIIQDTTPNDQNITLTLQYLFKKEMKIFISFLNPFKFKPAVDILINKKIMFKNY